MKIQNYTNTLRLNSPHRNRAQSLMCGRQPSRFVSRCWLRRRDSASPHSFVCVVLCATDCGWSYQAEKILGFLSQRALLEAYLIEGKFKFSPHQAEDLNIYFAFSGMEGLRRGLQSERSKNILASLRNSPS